MTTSLSRLLLVGYQGPEPDAEFWRFLEEDPPGGILLFKHNITSQAQLSDVLGRIQERAARPGEPPLMIGIDQEGGRVARLTAEVGFPAFPSARALATAENSLRQVIEAARTTARGLRSLGINMNFSPVLDVVTDAGNRVIGDRSFGDDPAVVEELGLAVIREHRGERVAATAKHFPGHGPTAVDSHLDLPVIGLSKMEMAHHLWPFSAAVVAGVAAIMTAHAVYPAYDSDHPATLSCSILTGILREQWGYDGVVVTDSLTMQAISRRQTVPQACVQAIAASADLLMVPASVPLYRDCISALEAAVESGQLPMNRVEEAARRVRDLRTSYAV